MPKSYRNRLNGNLPQFIEDVGKYGVWRAMDKYELKDYLAVKKLIMEETGDENYGLCPKLNTYHERGVKGILQEVVAAFADYVVRSEAQRVLLERQLEAYREDTRLIEGDFAEQLLGVAEALRASK